ncbi:syntaxin-121-like [Impatiens glandulifera]|uniref:syntaxin-121-like n=1 Tax=Impatiens glandulifera TaxID=253017 RepID=UPI001FB0D688|nr:syntaxin-121-like [Impatiens glandulifera]
MNNLLSSSFNQSQGEESLGDVQLSVNDLTGTGAPTLDKFFADVEAVKVELTGLETLHSKLQTEHEQSKTLHNAKSVKELREKMDADVGSALKKAKLIKIHLETLDRSNETSRNISGCGPGSSSDRTRTSLVNGLRKKLQDSMKSFNGLRNQIADDYRETVQRRYYTVTGEKADELTVDRLIETGESETFLQKAIQEQGRGKILDTIAEIQERYEGTKELERNLKELNQVFMDMAVLVDHQGMLVDDIENQVNRANSYVRDGTVQLQVARRHQKNTRKWTCFAIVLLLLIVLLVVLFTVKPWQKNK